MQQRLPYEGKDLGRAFQEIKELCQEGLPTQETVRHFLEALTQEVLAFHRRPLKDAYRYLLLDGLVFKVKGVLGRRRRTLLCALGITEGGRRGVIDFRLVKGESEGAWEAFLTDLYHRGLFGHSLRL